MARDLTISVALRVYGLETSVGLNKVHYRLQYIELGDKSL